MFDFPDTPSSGQIVIGPGGAQYRWDGVKWQNGSAPAGSSADAPSDGTLYGRLNAAWAAAAPLDSPAITGNASVAGALTVGNGLTATGNSFISGSLRITTATGGQLVLKASGSNSCALTLDNMTGAGSVILGLRNGAQRWQLLPGNANPEIGSNNGADFSIYRFADDGTTYLGTPLQIARASGVATFAQTPVMPGATVNGALTVGSATVSGALTVSGSTTASSVAVSGPANFGTNTAASYTLAINSAAANSRLIWLQSAGAVRWKFGADPSAEGGSNAGSNFIINRYDDGGSNLGTGLSINRATGVVTLGGDLATPSLTVNAGPTIRAGTGAATGTQPAGSMWMRTDGAVGSRIYVSAGAGTWAAIAGV